MKKQIFILTFLSLALMFAGLKSYGQLGPRTTPNPIDPLSCVGTSLPLHPFPGTAYTYTMEGDPAADEQPNQWTWFATKDPNFIVNGTLNTANMLTVASGALLDVSANYGTPGATNSVTITWSPEILAATEYQGDATGWATASGSNPTPTFVVGYATGVDCADNIEVFEINPQFNFTLDIANIDPDTFGTLDWDEDTDQCVDDVETAIYNSSSNELDMDYGTNTLYFEVVAANFVDNWTPTFNLISGLEGAQTAVVTLHASLADAQAGSNVLATDNWTNATTEWQTALALTATDPGDVVDGVSVFVKVVISNLTYESLDDNPFTLAVDAIDGDGQWDMEEDDCDPLTASNAADQIDQATHIVTARPTLLMDGGSMGEPSGADPEDVIEKTP